MRANTRVLKPSCIGRTPHQFGCELLIDDSKEWASHDVMTKSGGFYVTELARMSWEMSLYCYYCRRLNLVHL